MGAALVEVEAWEPLFTKARAHAAKIEGMLVSDDMVRKEHSEIEEMLHAQGREWARLMFEENARLRTQLEQRTAVVGADGVDRTLVRDSERHLETLVGRVPLGRLAYRAPGSEDLHPLDSALNLPRELYSHGLRRLVAKEAAKSSFDEVVETVRDFTGKTIGKRQVEEMAVRAAVDFEAFYLQRAASRDHLADLLILSTDAKGIVMRQEDLRAETRRKAEASAHKVSTRLSPGEKANRKRMAQVAAVYSIAPFTRSSSDILHSLRSAEEVDAKRPRPSEKRVWASVEKSERAVIREMFDEAERRDPDHRRRWIVLVDGDSSQLRAVKKEAKRLGVKVTIIVDVIHVIEYLWSAARALFDGTGSKAEKWVSDRLQSLLTGRSGGEVAKTIRWWESRALALSDASRAAIARSCEYLADRSRTRLMGYEDALRDGLPIATGVIEGACRHVVKDRMDITGARWSLDGAEAVLRLRALRASKDFDAYWVFHLEQEKLRNHTSRYEDGVTPEALPPRKGPLRRVK